MLFYSGWNHLNYAQIGLATSTDLATWKGNQPVLSNYSGWRNSSKTALPVYLETKSDSLFLMLMGTKTFSRSAKGKSGNVDDGQLGVYFSLDKGHSFIPHKNNPVMVNDYSNRLENEHLGGNIKLIKTDSVDYLFYHGKSSDNGWKYNVLMRKRVKIDN